MSVRRAALALALASSLAATTARPARAEVIDRVVAVLNDDAIFLSDLERRARPFLAEIAALRRTNPPEYARQRAEMLHTTLERMVDDALMRQAATRAHVTVNEEEIDQFIERIATQRGATPAQVYAALAQNGVTRAEYRSYMEAEILRLKVLQIRVRGRIHITESDLQEEYRRLVRESRGATVDHVAHILLVVPQDATPEQLVAIRRQADEVAARARAGEDFAALAREFSADTNTRETGGDLGEIPRGTLPEALDSAIGALQPGAVSNPVVGPNGLHVIRLVERRAVQPPPLTQVRDQVYASVLQREMTRQQRIYVQELRRGAAIDIRY